MKRRGFIKSVAAGAALYGAGRRARAGKTGGDRQNVLIVLDDQELRHMHTLPINLPGRDRLKPHAVEFSSAYCSHPLRSPSRVFSDALTQNAEIERVHVSCFAPRSPASPAKKEYDNG